MESNGSEAEGGDSNIKNNQVRMIQNHKLDELFKACDTKDTGVIGPEEFRELCDKFGICGSDSDVIFADLDHDGDGFIDFDDFSYGFRDFLTPGSRRGSLQINPVADPNVNNQQLLEMERRHATAKNAWKHFMTNVGPTNVQPFIATGKEQLYDIIEEIRHDGKDQSSTLEKALTGLIMDVQHLHEEYKSLENSFRKEREVHAAQLVALGEELDQQLAKAEAKAKAEAREEAQRQMDTERKKIATEIEGQLADLSSQIRTFQKVEEWLSDEEAREKGARAPEEHTKLHEAESENRNLRNALVEAQMKATMLQTQLTQKRNEYLDLFNALHSEKIAASEYKTQVNLMQNHLVVLSEANRVLSDANDCLSATQTQAPLSLPSLLASSPASLSSIRDGVSSSCGTTMIMTPSSPVGNGNSSPVSLSVIDNLSEASCHSAPASTSLTKSPDIRLQLAQNSPTFHDTDKDSGRSTLLDEIRAEGDGSPLPSGVWTGSSPGQFQPGGIMTLGNSIGNGSSCCGEERNVGVPSQDIENTRRSRHSLEQTYRSFSYGEEGDLYEALAGQSHPQDDSHGIGYNSGGNSDAVQVPDGYDNDRAEDRQQSLLSEETSLQPCFPQRTFKVILAGDAAVGKTTFIERICHGHFTPNLSSTIGVDFRVKTIELEGKCVALQLWDTAGQERFRSLTKSYFRRADGVVLMYDVSNERTFANIRNWIHNVEEGAGRKVPIVLSGNKVDLRDDKGDGRSHSHRVKGQCVSKLEGERLAAQCGAFFVETSPKTGHNVFEAIMMLAKEMSQVEDAELRNSLQLTERGTDDKNRKKGCCSSGTASAPSNTP